KSVSLRRWPSWSISEKRPPMGSLPHMTMSISSAAVRSCSCGAGHNSQPAAPARMPPTKADSSRRQFIMAAGCSHTESEARASRRLDELVRHGLAHRAGEIVTTAMHRDDHVRIERFDFADHLLEVCVGRRPEMKTTDKRVHLLHT